MRDVECEDVRWEVESDTSLFTLSTFSPRLLTTTSERFRNGVELFPYRIVKPPAESTDVIVQLIDAVTARDCNCDFWVG